MSHEMATIARDLQLFFTPLGLEVHPFQVGWYNDAVSEHFKLEFEPDVIGFVILSTPSMFEDAFIPYLKKNADENLFKTWARSPDPLDSCMRYTFQQAAAKVSSRHVEIIQDFEILPNKRPKILVQTAAHVAGAAYYYQKSDVYFHSTHESCGNKTLCDAKDDITVQSEACMCVDPWKGNKRIYGVCIHPKYGGWFAIRGVLIFPNLQADILRQPPVDCVKTRESRIELLNRFNGNWQDCTFRDIIPVTTKYSGLQKKYFATAPKDRHSLLFEIINS